LRRRCDQKVARRETSGQASSANGALKVREIVNNNLPRFQRGNVTSNYSRRFTSGYFLIAAHAAFKEFSNNSPNY
jgi:hypothetical protein